MQQEKGFIKYIVIIIIILVAIFLSRQPFFRERGKNLFLKASEPVQNYLEKGSNWVRDIVYPKISGEVEKRGQMIKEEVDTEKQKISETIGEKIKNYFSEVVDNVFNPGKVQQNQSCSQACPATEPQTQP